MSEYLNFGGDDFDPVLDTFLDGGWSPEVDAMMGGGFNSGAPTDAGFYDGYDFSGGESGNYSTDERSNAQLVADLGLNGGDSSLLKSVEGWLKQNPNLAKLGLSGVAGLAGAYSANKAGQNSLDQLKEQEAQKLRTRERVSDSILGMAPFQVAGAQPLQRLDGTRVFGQDGKIMR